MSSYTTTLVTVSSVLSSSLPPPSTIPRRLMSPSNQSYPGKTGQVDRRRGTLSYDTRAAGHTAAPAFAMHDRVSVLDMSDAGCYFPIGRRTTRYAEAEHSAATPKQCFNCCDSTHFGENQLALGLSGISPPTTTHPLILQHQCMIIRRHRAIEVLQPGTA